MTSAIFSPAKPAAIPVGVEGEGKGGGFTAEHVKKPGKWSGPKFYYPRLWKLIQFSARKKGIFLPPEFDVRDDVNRHFLSLTNRVSELVEN